MAISAGAQGLCYEWAVEEGDRAGGDGNKACDYYCYEGEEVAASSVILAVRSSGW
jgi:hypothetical protein